MKKKILSLFLLINIFFISIPVYATEIITTNQQAQTVVTADVGSSFSVQIPKSIELSDDDNDNVYEADYIITTIGDIAGDEVLSVVPDYEITFITDNKNSIKGIVTQDKTTWYYDEFDTVANGNISTSELSAGNWEGTLNFSIGLEKIGLQAGLYDAEGVMLCSWEELESYGFDIDADVDIKDIATEGEPSTALYSVLNGEYADELSSGTKVVIPSNVTSIGAMAFWNVPMIYYNGASDGSPWGALGLNDEYCVGLTAEDVESLNLIDENGVATVPSTVERDGVTYKVSFIGEKCFANNEDLIEIEIPNNIFMIDYTAFLNCSNLTTVKYEDNSQLVMINAYAFEDCSSLETIYLPSSLWAIDEGVFIECSSLKTVYYEGTMTDWNYISIAGYNNPLWEAKIVCNDGILNND